ncbi:MAG TPA: DUF2807 domain-containing protein [Pyrinomonadaceae bacterium]|nr:DUF2807 domain-containing protein [Pyrinomonadaceae bacterium]
MFAINLVTTLSLFVFTVASPFVADSVPFPRVDLEQEVIQVAPFNSVELRNGGRVFVRHGARQSVTVVKGNSDEITFTVEGSRLVIDKVKSSRRGHDLEIEIVTPNINGLAVNNGGVLQTVGDFSGQTALAVSVNQGGIVDARSIAVQSVTASVYSGGRIFVRPQAALVASVAQGGAITYWGKPQVTSSIKHGGVVEEGEPTDFDKPLSEVGVYAPPVPTGRRIHP